jgi:hypothetical protein
MNNMKVLEFMHFSWAINESEDIFVELRKRFQREDYYVFS